MHQKRKKKQSFWLHEEWLSPQRAIILFLSESHLSRKERHLYFLPAKCIRKGQKNCSFWLHDVQKERYLYFFPYKIHQKREKKIVPFDYMKKKNGSLHKKSIFLFLLTVIFLEKNGHLYFCLAKCIRKRQKKLFLLTTWC